MLHILGIAAAAGFLFYNVREVHGAFIARRFAQRTDGPVAMVGLLRVVAVHVFTYWSVGPVWALVAAGIMVLAGWAPWALREHRVGRNEPVVLAQEVPAPVEPGEPQYAGAAVLDQSDREAFDDLARRFDKD